MKRIGYLWEKFCCMETAVQAITLGTQHKRHDHAVKRKLCYDTSDERMMYQLDPEKVGRLAEQILTELREGWQHGAMREKVIHPIRGKERKIDSPNLKDHIIHWMLILAIKEPLTRGMYEHSYGSIPKRGIEGARKTVERWVRHDKRTKYFVKLDIRKFYPNVDQERLKACFRRVIKDERILKVIDETISCVPKGLPIGTYTSQWFANFFLQRFDHHIAQELFKVRRGKKIPIVRHYMRYMDDMLLMGSSKRDLEKAVREVIRFAREEMGFAIKPTWEICEIANDRHGSGKAIDIVGYRFYRRRTEVRGSIFLHYRRAMAKAVKHLKRFGAVALAHAETLLSLHGWFLHADAGNFLQRIHHKVSIQNLKGVVSHATKHGTFYEAECV